MDAENGKMISADMEMENTYDYEEDISLEFSPVDPAVAEEKLAMKADTGEPVKGGPNENRKFEFSSSSSSGDGFEIAGMDGMMVIFGLGIILIGAAVCGVMMRKRDDEKQWDSSSFEPQYDYQESENFEGASPPVARKTPPARRRGCTGCGSPLTFIPEYGMHYCYTCGRYAKKSPPGTPDHKHSMAPGPTMDRSPICQHCGTSMSKIEQYNAWYCYRCSKYGA